MSDEKFKEQYRIPSARAAWHDYNGGYYFITVCTKKCEHSFGEIRCNIDCENVTHDVSNDACGENTMILSAIGQFLHDTLQNAALHYPYAEIPLFVVMPNHWHAIVFIDGDKTPEKSTTDGDCGDCRDVARYVSTDTDTKTNEKMIEIARRQSLLSWTIRGLKSAVTKFANANDIEFEWQTRYHDKIIRNQTAMNKIADYIAHNIATWNTDCYNEPL
jgi:REP element-mobilizing transposase RayT